MRILRPIDDELTPGMDVPLHELLSNMQMFHLSSESGIRNIYVVLRAKDEGCRYRCQSETVLSEILS